MINTINETNTRIVINVKEKDNAGMSIRKCQREMVILDGGWGRPG